MTYYKEGTNIRFTDEDYVELTLARLSRIAAKGVHPGRFNFLVHEAREVLNELITEIRGNVLFTQGVERSGPVKNLDKVL